MLKKRLTAVLTLRDGIVVQSIGFKKYLPIGRVDIAVEFLNRWGIDEIILIDISATRDGRRPNFELVKQISKKCFVPLTVGGGIKTVEDMQMLVKNGADKIAINSFALKDPELIKKGAAVLGNQCIVVSIDAKKKGQGYEVFSHSGVTTPKKDVAAWAKKTADSGAGEILLNSIERDGSKKGFDTKLISIISESVNIPVIALGGAGHPQDFADVFTKTKASSAAAGNYFHFSEHSVNTTKAYLHKKGVDVRMETFASYDDFDFDDLGRAAKKSDKYLMEQRFKYYPPEII